MAGMDFSMLGSASEDYTIPDFYTDMEMLGFLRVHRLDSYLEQRFNQKIEMLWKEENRYDFHRDLNWNIRHQQDFTKLRIRMQRGLMIIKNLKNNVGAVVYAGSIPLTIRHAGLK